MAGTGAAATVARQGIVRPRVLRMRGGRNTKTPRFGIEGGVRRWTRTMRLTFLSKARAATAGRRPDFRPRGRSP